MKIQVPRNIDFGDEFLNLLFGFLKQRWLLLLLERSMSREPIGMINIQDLRDCAMLTAQEFGEPGFVTQIYDMLHELFKPLEAAEKDMKLYGMPREDNLN